MKNFIKSKLQEALKKLPYDPRPEMKDASNIASLSQPTRTLDLDKIKFRIAKAAQIATQYKTSHPEDNYFLSPTEGDGFYQVQFKHDGQIKTQHIKASGDMNQLNGAFQPSDVGTCKSFQNIARYCFVKAGKQGSSVGASPAEDAANKALIIFRQEILDFLSDGGYDDGKAPEISKEKMTDKLSQHKTKKDLETKIGRRLSDSEWLAYQQTGQEPKGKSTLTTQPDVANDYEKKQAMLRDKIAGIKAKRG